MLVFVPKTVNGKPLTLRSLGELVKKPKQGHPTKYVYFWDTALQEHGDKPVQTAHWALMSRDVIPGSRKISYDDQVKLVGTTSQKTKAPYQVPNLLDATLSIFLEYVVTGTRLYSDKPWTFIRCQERVSKYPEYPLVVGGFAAGGLSVDSYDWDREYSGVGVLRKF